MKKIFLFLLLTCSTAFSQSYFKTGDKNYELSKKEKRELKKYYQPTDSISAVALRDKLAHRLEKSLEFKDYAVNKRGSDGKISKVAYFYKNQKGKEIVIIFRVLYQGESIEMEVEGVPTYRLYAIESPFKNLFNIWSEDFFKGIDHQKVLKKHKYRAYKDDMDNKFLLSKQKKDIWRLDNKSI